MDDELRQVSLPFDRLQLAEVTLRATKTELSRNCRCARDGRPFVPLCLSRGCSSPARAHKVNIVARTHVNAFYGLVAKLEDALYASGHFLVFPLFILPNVNASGKLVGTLLMATR